MTPCPHRLHPIALVSLVSFALLGPAATAAGHADVEDSGFRRSTNGVVTVHIQHGCSAENAKASAVDRVAVLVPKSFPRAVPQAIAGWQATSTTTADGRRLEWRRVKQRSAVQSFRISVRFPAKAGVYGLPTVQYCDKASLAWIERPAGGEEPEHPLPTVTVT